MSSVFYLIAVVPGLLGLDASGTGQRADAPKPDDPADVAAFEGSPAVHVEKDLDGNVSSVHLRASRRPSDEDIRRLTRLGHVRALSFHGVPTDECLPLIRAWPGLHRFVVPGSTVTPGALDALSALPELQEVDLTGAKLTDDALQHLTGPPTLGILNLRLTAVSDAGLAHVARLRGLRVLDLTRDRVSDAGVRRLSGLRNLETLILVDTDVQGAGLGALRGLGNLRQLNLRATGVAEESVAPLRAITGLHVEGVRTGRETLRADDPKSYPALRAAGLLPKRDAAGDVRSLDAHRPERAPREWIAHLKGLHSLEELLLGPAITDADVARVGEVPSLLRLRISDSGLTNAGLADIARLPRLTRLELFGCQRITDEGLGAVAQINSLESLSLSECPITGAGLRQLAALKKLKFLDLCRTRVTDRTVASVTAITGLEGLDLQETAVTDAGLATLRGMEELTFINVRRCPTSGPGIIYPRGRDGPDYGRGLRQFLDQNERRR
jgi:hypothetical protein